MREVLPELMRWWRAGETVGVGTVVATFRSAPRPPGASMLVGPAGEAVGSVSGGCVEGAVYELGQAVVGSGDPGAPAVRRQRRRRVRGRADLRRHPRRVRREGRPADLPRARRDRRRRRGRPPGGGGDRHGAPRPGLGRAAARRAPRGGGEPPVLGARSAAPAPTPRSPTTPAGCSPPGHTETLTYGPDGERRGEGLRVFVVVVRAAAADAGLRRHRLRRRGRPGRATSSATR